MAETSVLSALDLLGSPIKQELERAAAKFLIAHASGLDGVPAKIERIQTVLRTIVPLLRHADRSDLEPSVGDWVAKVRTLAQEMEDIVEDYMYDAFAGVGGGVIRVVHGIEHAGDKWKTYRRTAQSLESILPIADEILHAHNTVMPDQLFYGLAISPSETPLAKSYSSKNLSREDFAIPMKGQRAKDLAQVKTWIAKPAKSMVIAIHGQGGLGKTTLAKEIFRDPTVSRRFTTCTWMAISGGEDGHSVLRRLAMKLSSEGDASSTVEEEEEEIGGELAIERIRGAMRGNRCLIILDEVWDRAIWDVIGNVFEMNQDQIDNGSRIIVATGEKDVVRCIEKEGGQVLSLGCLTRDEEWELFCERCFRLDPEPGCPKELESAGRRIASQCAGLPLAVVAAAEVMSAKERQKSVWEKSCRTMEVKLEQGIPPSHNVLMHCYYELPARLKRCFLYCGIFPEDCLIGRKQLVRLWVAEGFIVEKNGKAVEELAEFYLRELIHRNMIEVAAQNDSGRVKSCRMHGTLRTLALDIARKQRFGMFSGEKTRNIRCHARRLSLRNPGDVDGGVSPRLRSLLVFSDDHKLGTAFSSRLKLLKVLELRGAPITEIPEWVFRLYNLRYLGLRGTKIIVDVFPKEVEQLQRLETLDLWRTEVGELPRNIVKLQNLRHLHCGGTNASDMKYRNPLRFRGREAARGIWDMKNLQTLKTVEATDELVKRLGEMTQLRTLSIIRVTHQQYLPLLDSVSRMWQLTHLAVKASSNKVIALESLRATPPRLSKLLLEGCFRCAPGWFQELENLTHLYLFGSGACESPLEKIGLLPNLALLAMKGAYTGEELVFRPQWFPRLRRLCLEDMSVRSVVVGKGALPVLGKLRVSRCGSLGRGWQGMEHLTALEELSLREATRELMDFLQPICVKMNVKLWGLEDSNRG